MSVVAPGKLAQPLKQTASSRLTQCHRVMVQGPLQTDGGPQAKSGAVPFSSAPPCAAVHIPLAQRPAALWLGGCWCLGAAVARAAHHGGADGVGVGVWPKVMAF